MAEWEAQEAHRLRGIVAAAVRSPVITAGRPVVTPAAELLAAVVRATLLPKQGATVDPFGGPKGATLQLSAQSSAATTARGVAVPGADLRLTDRHSVVVKYMHTVHPHGS